MKLFASLVLTVLAINASAKEWTPPKNPDVKAIRDEAKADANAGRYESALQKYLWWYENVNKYQPSMSAVRLSFGLSDWYQLGEVYPPALAKLKETRDRAAERIKSKIATRVSFDDFQEFAAINRELGENDKTVEMFKLVDEKNPEEAGLVFGVSKPALIKAKEYKLCGKYLRPERSVDNTLRLFKLDSQMTIDAKFADAVDLLKDSRNRRFIEDAATVVALLVINDRKEEAENAIVRLKTVEADADFHKKLATALNEALKGKLPNP